MYSSRYSRGEDELAAAAMSWAMFILFLAYVVSVIVTRLILHFLVNPLLDGKLDEDDQWVILSAGIVWGLVGLLAAPFILGAGITSGAVLESLAMAAGPVVSGVAWGLLAGFGVLIWMWWEVPVPTFQPVPGFSRIVDSIPIEHHISVQSDGNSEPTPTIEELEKAYWRNDQIQEVMPVDFNGSPPGSVEDTSNTSAE